VVSKSEVDELRKSRDQYEKSKTESTAKSNPQNGIETLYNGKRQDKSPKSSPSPQSNTSEYEFKFVGMREVKNKEGEHFTISSPDREILIAGGYCTTGSGGCSYLIDASDPKRWIITVKNKEPNVDARVQLYAVAKYSSQGMFKPVIESRQ
jgi:hypothetical protein